MMNFLSKLSNSLIALILIVLALVSYRVAFYTFVDNYEYAYIFNGITGEMKPLLDKEGKPQQGYIFSWPIVNSIHTIDTRPMQVCINANSKVLNCKLVQFDPKGFATFVAWHGRGNYSQLELEDILRSYAYDPSKKPYPFLIVLKELKNIEMVETSKIPVDDTIQNN